MVVVVVVVPVLHTQVKIVEHLDASFDFKVVDSNDAPRRKRLARKQERKLAASWLSTSLV